MRTEAQSQLVVKSNNLIQRSRFNLSVQEQKIILYLISKIKPSDNTFLNQDFNISDFCKTCGIDHDNGKNYKNIKNAIKTLADKSIWIKLENNKETLIRWINKAWIDEDSGTLKIRLDDDMKPYLLQLQERFTQYELLYTLAMKSQYSLRLYELLKSYEFQHTKTFNIDELKRILYADHYTRFSDLKKYVFDIAMREINNLSDLKVTYETIKEGRRYTKVNFKIKLKKNANEKLETLVRIDELLNPAQAQMSFLNNK